MSMNSFLSRGVVAEDDQLFEIDANGSLHFKGEGMVSESVELSIRVRDGCARASVEPCLSWNMRKLIGDSVEMLTDGMISELGGKGQGGSDIILEPSSMGAS